MMEYDVDAVAALLLISPGLLLVAGLAALACGHSFRACLAARALAVPASLLGLAASLAALWQGTRASFLLPWPLPLGECRFAVDPLASAFLVPLFLLSALAALVLPARARFFEDQAHLGRHCFFFCLLSASMALVILAADGLFFLLLWEIMSLAPFFLLSHSDKSAIERYASWVYLVAAHLGALPLLLLFTSLTLQAGSSDFAAFFVQPVWQYAGLLFTLALVGFGTKSGLFPLHMWMPEAHASAPGHVAVLLSGAMLNVGLYGIMRVLGLLGLTSLDWAYPLMLAGGLSGILGILLGLVQSDMKRTLAYSSAENMGIILLAMGGALLALRNSAETAAFLLLLGLFLHIWNHSIFKSLLFLGANAVKESTHVTTLQRLGGLARRMPLTSQCFAAGSAAIAGVPPLNGFLGELLLYLGFAAGAAATRGTEAVFVFWVAFFTLGTIAGFSLFAFTRVFGLAFLGASRSPEAALAREPEGILRRVMLLLAALCLLISIFGPLLLDLLTPALLSFFESLGMNFYRPDHECRIFAFEVLQGYALMALVLPLLLGLCLLPRFLAVRRNGQSSASTWGCGYTTPSPRMQYTGGSFAHSAALLLKLLIRPDLETPKVRALFPGRLQARMTGPDWPTQAWTRILFRPVALLAERTKDFQHGLLNIYILYILVALTAALVWALGVTA